MSQVFFFPFFCRLLQNEKGKEKKKDYHSSNVQRTRLFDYIVWRRMGHSRLYVNYQIGPTMMRFSNVLNETNHFFFSLFLSLQKFGAGNRVHKICLLLVVRILDTVR